MKTGLKSSHRTLADIAKRASQPSKTTVYTAEQRQRVPAEKRRRVKAGR